MNVILMNNDYHVNLSMRDLKKATKPITGFVSLRYKSLTAKVIDQTTRKKVGDLGVMCTNDSDVFHAPGSIEFEIDEVGPLFRVFPAELYKLVTGELEFLMTRYDGENKVWFRREN